LDIRESRDRQYAMKLLDEADSSWSMARSFDELSNAAKDNVIRSAKALAGRLIMQRRNRGTAGGHGTPMTDPGQSQRMERVKQVARQFNYDMTTGAGRRAALSHVAREHPNLAPRQLGRPGGAVRYGGYQGVSGSGVGLIPHLADTLDGSAKHAEGPAGAGENSNGAAHTPPAPAVPLGGFVY
jgi:hypothetical protein